MRPSLPQRLASPFVRRFALPPPTALLLPALPVPALRLSALLCAALLFGAAGTARADPPAWQDAPTPASGDTGGTDAISRFFADWEARVSEAQASQPHWMTPLVTVTPRLEQEVRYDQVWEHQPNGASLQNYDNGKGLELIPTTTNEIILTVPAYQERELRGTHTTGWGDYPIFLLKQRLFSENEQHGNAIVTAFLAVTAPTGSRNFTNHAWVVTPTIAGGKGWGDFDVQATMGVALPINYLQTTGAQLLTNVALQYHLLRYLWPEIEFNDTIWLSGSQRGGKNQLFITPGLILGRFNIIPHTRLIIGAGYQTAVTPTERLTGELLPVYDHAWILTARLGF